MSKIIVVTGASSGIGAAITRLLADEGHTVIGIARRSEKIDEIAKEKTGRKIHSLKVDITIEAEVVQAFDGIQKKFGKIDVMINNAGKSTMNQIKEANLDFWRKEYELNVFAVVACTREALKIISDNGTIINVSSILGQENLVKGPGWGIYTSSKHALRIMTRALRVELVKERPNIKVALLNPGLTESEMTVERIKGNLYISPNDVARGASYIISNPPFVNVSELTILHSGNVI